ncbi:MAG: PstS family phosphate ABC transporter substrate-binding protein [Sphingobacteriaceae bacterium]
MLLLVASCQQHATDKPQSYTSGEATVVVDESFAPVIDDQLFVFHSAYPEVQITPIYKPENELLKLFLTDSVRIAVMSRTLSADEEQFFKHKNITIRVNRFAVDGIALITQNSNRDSLVKVQDIIQVMKGQSSKIASLVFDNPNSSTVRYLKELAGVSQLPAKGIYALKSNPDVIRYVASHSGSIGVVGINWIEQPDVDLEQDVAKLKVLAVKNLPGKLGSDQYYKPTQNDLALGFYPLMRNLYLINCEGGAGPGTGFVTFVAGERGQRMILKSGLLPDSIPSREIIIRK